MDPLGSLLNIYQVVCMIREAVELAISNREQCKRLEERVELIVQILQSYFPAPQIDTSVSLSLSTLCSSTRAHPAFEVQQQKVQQLAVQFSPEATQLVKDKVAQHGQPEALSRALKQLTVVLNNALQLANKFHGGMSGKNFQQACIAKIKRAALMSSYQGDFADASEDIGQCLQLLQTVLQLDARSDLKKMAEWRQQDQADAAADAQALRVQLESLKDVTQEGFKRSDQYSQEIIDMNYQANRQLESLSHNVKIIMHQLAGGQSSSAPSMSLSGSGPSTPSLLMSNGSFSGSSAAIMAYDSAVMKIDPRLSTPLYKIEFEHLIAGKSPLGYSKVYSGKWSGHEVAIKSFEDWST